MPHHSQARRKDAATTLFRVSLLLFLQAAIGDFSKIQNPSLLAARMGQALSTTTYNVACSMQYAACNLWYAARMGQALSTTIEVAQLRHISHPTLDKEINDGRGGWCVAASSSHMHSHVHSHTGQVHSHVHSHTGHVHSHVHSHTGALVVYSARPCADWPLPLICDRPPKEARLLAASLPTLHPPHYLRYIRLTAYATSASLPTLHPPHYLRYIRLTTYATSASLQVHC